MLRAKCSLAHSFSTKVASELTVALSFTALENNMKTQISERGNLSKSSCDLKCFMTF